MAAPYIVVREGVILLLGCLWANPVELYVLFVCFFFFLFFSFFFFFRVGKSLACHSPGKWCLCA